MNAEIFQRGNYYTVHWPEHLAEISNSLEFSNVVMVSIVTETQLTLLYPSQYCISDYFAGKDFRMFPSFDRLYEMDLDVAKETLRFIPLGEVALHKKEWEFWLSCEPHFAEGTRERAKTEVGENANRGTNLGLVTADDLSNLNWSEYTAVATNVNDSLGLMTSDLLKRKKDIDGRLNTFSRLSSWRKDDNSGSGSGSGTGGGSGGGFYQS